jgi:Flp pilus assembly protein TadD
MIGQAARTSSLDRTMPSNHRGKHQPRDKDELREEALRPHPWLGYDRDGLAAHLMRREAFEIAEGQFRRAIWLNPYEAAFKAHLAWCLCKQGRLEEAADWAAQALQQKPEDRESQDVAEFVRQAVRRREAERRPSEQG